MHSGILTFDGTIHRERVRGNWRLLIKHSVVSICSAVQRGREADEHAGQLLNLGVGVGVPERRCSPGDFLLQRNAVGRRVSRDGQENVRRSNAEWTVLV